MRNKTIPGGYTSWADWARHKPASELLEMLTSENKSKYHIHALNAARKEFTYRLTRSPTSIGLIP